MSNLFQISNGAKVVVEPDSFFSVYSEKKYQIVYDQNGFTWDQARIDAENRGGRLAIVKDHGEWLLMRDLIANDAPNTRAYWIGASGEIDVEQNETWGWVDGSLINFSAWRPGEPNDAFGKNSENCLEVSPNGLWNDFPCGSSQNKSYIMEIN